MSEQFLPDYARASGWAHESIWFIERMRLGAILRQTDERALFQLLQSPFQWSIRPHKELVGEITAAWNDSIPEMHKQLDRDEVWNIRLDDEGLDHVQPLLAEIHGNLRTLIAKL